MNILVTGGAGYIGSVLVPMLLEWNYKVTVIDSFLYNQFSLLNCCYHPYFEIVKGDVRDPGLIAKHIKEKDFIIPLACLVGAPICDRFPEEARAINLDAINLILEFRREGQNIIFPNTNSGYGIGQEGIYCTEDTPLNPVSRYGKLKVSAEKAIRKTQDWIVLRLATAFGVSPRMRIDLLVNDFVYRAVNDGYVVLYESQFKRNYIHIRDIARAFIHCLRNFAQMENEVYNIGLNDANLSKRELCEEIKKEIPDFYFIEAEVGEDQDKRNYIVSNEKIEKTGFVPMFTLKHGIRELIKGYKIIKRSEFSNV